VLLIEDCAQALGAYIKGESVGLKGCVGIYSFFATKIITSGGQGGMVVSKDQEVVQKIRDYREFDYRQDRLPRFNFQLTDLQAAVGRVQLSRLPNFLSRRKQIFESYKQYFPMLEPDVGSDKKGAVCYRAVMKTKTPQDIINRLNSSGIKSIVPIEDWELLGDASLFPNAHEMTQTTISLPIYPSLSNSDVDYIIETVSSYCSS
jgi:perosamine synthetase